jgi:hypothetical protein
MPIRVGRGKSAVVLEGLDADEIERELNAELGDIMDVLRDQAKIIREKAQDKWPVKTGKSKAGFYEITTIDADILEVSILNKESYVPYIKSTKVGEEENAVRNRSPLGDLKKEANRARKDVAIMVKAVLQDKLQKMLGGN